MSKRSPGRGCITPKRTGRNVEGTIKWLKNERRGIQHQFRETKWILGRAQSSYDDKAGEDSVLKRSEVRENIRKCEVLIQASRVHSVAKMKVRRLNKDGIVCRVNRPDFQLDSEGRMWNDIFEEQDPLSTEGMSVTHQRASWASRGTASASASPGAASASGEGGQRAAASGDGGERAAASGENGEPSAASQWAAAAIGVARKLVGGCSEEKQLEDAGWWENEALKKAAQNDGEAQARRHRANALRDIFGLCRREVSSGGGSCTPVKAASLRRIRELKMALYEKTDASAQDADITALPTSC